MFLFFQKDKVKLENSKKRYFINIKCSDSYAVDHLKGDTIMSAISKAKEKYVFLEEGITEPKTEEIKNVENEDDSSYDSASYEEEKTLNFQETINKNLIQNEEIKLEETSKTPQENGIKEENQIEEKSNENNNIFIETKIPLIHILVSSIKEIAELFYKNRKSSFEHMIVCKCKKFIPYNTFLKAFIESKDDIQCGDHFLSVKGKIKI